MPSTPKPDKSLTRHPSPSPGRASSSARRTCRCLATASRRRPAEVVQLDWLELLGGQPAPRRAADPVLFGSTVRDARITRNLTQAQTAALAGISRSALGNIETGTFPAGLGTQARLATVLGLSPAA